ncbi:hypothetical protein [Bacillus salacetis]|uniref:hypothetical protein n=1 Tax=Bacillus salacetis TaxID=2315464 RepID=UPI00109BA9C4|nr:hypothetical protein [Bacillus salacetis]
MKKIIRVTILVLVMSLLGVSSSLAASGTFVTEDGSYETSVATTSSKNDVRISVSRLQRHYSNGASGSAGASMLQARLCSASTGNCTVFQSLSGGSTTFTNMIPSTYYVDIRDSLSDSVISGYVNAYAY